MKTPIDRATNGRSIVSKATASASATWLRNNKQTNSGKSFEPIKK